MTKEALKLALEALEDRSSLMKWQSARNALRQALEQHPADEPVVAGEPAPANSLPSWVECAVRVRNSDYTAKRKANGGYGAEPDVKMANALHRFIYEYDDASPYKSAWFLHRLEQVLKEATRPQPAAWVNATTWRGLTDEEIQEIALELPMDAVRIAEAALRSKNT